MGLKITPFLWFDGQAEEAATFYVSVFKDAELLDVSRYGEGAPFPAGTALVASFRLGNLTFSGLNGGPHYTFSEAISFSIDCADQDEVDYYWEKLAEGGSEGPCGWLKDKYGLAWQVVPRILPELLQGENPTKAAATMQAMMQMSKLDVAKLQAAYDEA